MAGSLTSTWHSRPILAAVHGLLLDGISQPPSRSRFEACGAGGLEDPNVDPSDMGFPFCGAFCGCRVDDFLSNFRCLIAVSCNFPHILQQRDRNVIWEHAIRKQSKRASSESVVISLSKWASARCKVLAGLGKSNEDACVYKARTHLVCACARQLTGLVASSRKCQVSDDIAVVGTLDFFTPIVDEPEAPNPTDSDSRRILFQLWQRLRESESFRACRTGPRVH